MILLLPKHSFLYALGYRKTEADWFLIHRDGIEWLGKIDNPDWPPVRSGWPASTS